MPLDQVFQVRIRYENLEVIHDILQVKEVDFGVIRLVEIRIEMYSPYSLAILTCRIIHLQLLPHIPHFSHVRGFLMLPR